MRGRGARNLASRGQHGRITIVYTIKHEKEKVKAPQGA